MVSPDEIQHGHPWPGATPNFSPTIRLGPCRITWSSNYQELNDSEETCMINELWLPRIRQVSFQTTSLPCHRLSQKMTLFHPCNPWTRSRNLRSEVKQTIYLYHSYLRILVLCNYTILSVCLYVFLPPLRRLYYCLGLFARYSLVSLADSRITEKLWLKRVNSYVYQYQYK